MSASAQSQEQLHLAEAIKTAEEFKDKYDALAAMLKSDQRKISELNRALLNAAKSGDINTVEVLLDLSIHVDTANDKGSTALTLAAENGHADIVKMLLDKKANVNHTTANGGTSLIYAACKGHADIVNMLLDEGADPNHVHQYSSTALTWAAENGHTNIVKMLLDKKANVNHAMSNGKTSLTYAIEKGHTEIVIMLLQTQPTVSNTATSLIRAAGHGQTQEVQALLEKGLNVNDENQYGSIALRLAYRNSHTEIVKILLAKIDNISTLVSYGEFSRAKMLLGNRLNKAFPAFSTKLGNILNIDKDSAQYLAYFATISMIATIFILSLVVLPLVSPTAIAIILAADALMHCAIIFRLMAIMVKPIEAVIATPVEKAQAQERTSLTSNKLAAGAIPVATPAATNEGTVVIAKQTKSATSTTELPPFPTL